MSVRSCLTPEPKVTGAVGHNVIADTDTTPDDESTVSGCRFEKSESRAWRARHYPRCIRNNFEPIEITYF